MEYWHFSESAYPYLPDLSETDSIRVSLPNRVFDPEKGAALYNRYLDDWQVADGLGLNVMTNEHHQTPTCIQPAVGLTAAILARITRDARILVLGNPVANRRDPVRVAEEMAVVDNISRGRLEVGFVRSVPFEVLPANSNPVGLADRMWEAHDLIKKAWTTHDGPFSWEGTWHYRHVNIWPRPYQQPHPPIWITSTSKGGIRPVALNGYVLATFLTGFDTTRMLYDTYRQTRLDEGLEPLGPDRFAYCGLVHVGESDEAAFAAAEQLRWYFDINKVPPHLSMPPGYVPAHAAAAALKGGGPGRGPFGGMNPKGQSVEWLIEQGIMFAGSPDTVAAQIRRLHDRVGGFGHLLMMGQAGLMSHETVSRSLELFANEVAPQLKELNVGTAESTK
ncbi:LLM class flavin-dependent oxidoreductase [Streptomyces sp. NBC_00988]|uniref:LLM class flavin-dependent oxidoreductase n=1 Tax=Streptomyces sp. NBC_00988 TaxID=2903704 RepID=UPI00386C8BE0|nr:LLM class flavin-dependent oxidoreductase [Streptomyces sp. NBC_00988]